MASNLRCVICFFFVCFPCESCTKKSVSVEELASKMDVTPISHSLSGAHTGWNPGSASLHSLPMRVESNVDCWIDMPAPKENIKAKITRSDGKLDVVLDHVEQTRGQVKLDLSSLTTETFDDQTKNEAQTHHAHIWLELGDDSKQGDVEGERAKNRWAVFTIESLELRGEADVRKLDVRDENGEQVRNLTALARGELFLHGVTKKQEVLLAIKFINLPPSGAQNLRIVVATAHPLRIQLSDFDIRPRDSFGKLAQSAFSLMGTKVAETASINFVMKVR